MTAPPLLHPCGRPVEMMSVAGYGGWSEVPMICLECPGEWEKQGLCCECGAEGAKAVRAGEQWGGLPDGKLVPYEEREVTTIMLCGKHRQRFARPDNCEGCGRFMSDGEWVEMGEEPGYYDPYFGPQPPEPIGKLLCGRCRERRTT